MTRIVFKRELIRIYIHTCIGNILSLSKRSDNVKRLFEHKLKWKSKYFVPNKLTASLYVLKN